MQATMGTAPPTATVVPAAGEALASSEAAAAAHSRNKYAPAAEIIDSLPVETLHGKRHRLYGGFWQAEFILKGMAAARTCFKPDPSATDIIILATLPKSGTTWLKALAFATLNRATHSSSDSQHPLRHQNPHDCVSWLELVLMQGQGQDQDDGDGDGDGDATFPASSPRPRLLHTHLPYSMLPHGIAAEGSRCRIVYVCRDPKDVVVSAWNFQNKRAAARSGGDAGGEDRESAAAGLTLTRSFGEAFELFCEGRFHGGPYWLHALEYWQESQRRPNEVLFLRYEDMLGDPAGNLKKLAAFMGCTFSPEEEETGVPEQIVELCSLDSLKNMDVNQSGTTLMGVQNEAFFRKGQVGDWKNYMTMDMAASLDKIVEEATRGSGLTFGDADPSSYGLM